MRLILGLALGIGIIGASHNTNATQPNITRTALQAIVQAFAQFPVPPMAPNGWAAPADLAAELQEVDEALQLLNETVEEAEEDNRD